ncbi:hypothetical protein [Eudoraea adriatica]|uniref:hypothetical protein n=1 Tax=Eudoraea adriatica TaxID=446681 RepID=UPI0003AB0F9A|nr:hypothetical protein [Eudoraea adriatica]
MSWKKTPNWTENLLQGTSFWMGYKTQLFRHYPLTEGAIVGEAVSLIKGSLKDNFTLDCELKYKNLNVPKLGKKRADLVIKNNGIIDSVIEVKRAKSSNKEVTKDFIRLAQCHKENPSVRCFLLLVSQKFRPSKYVMEDGKAILNEIIDEKYIAKVRRACKAASSFESKKSAHYSCLIEVKYHE